MSTEYQEARRFVLRRLEAYLEESLCGQYEWLTETEDGTREVPKETYKTRLKAVKSVRKELSDRGYR